jgi:hypothetical protein
VKELSDLPGIVAEVEQRVLYEAWVHVSRQSLAVAAFVMP